MILAFDAGKRDVRHAWLIEFSGETTGGGAARLRVAVVLNR